MTYNNLTTNFRINNVFSTVNDAEEETNTAEGVVNEFSDKVQRLNDRVQAVNNFGMRNINEQIANSKSILLTNYKPHF
jgi:hypothetical protein